MKLLVDEMPSWRGDCPFVEEKWNWDNQKWTYICKLINEYCNLDEIEDECQMLKKLR